MNDFYFREGQRNEALQDLQNRLDVLTQEIQTFDIQMKAEHNEARLKEMRMERLKLRFMALKYLSEIEALQNSSGLQDYNGSYPNK